MESQDVLLLTGCITLLGSLVGLAGAAYLGKSLFTAGCIFYGFWIIYFAVPMLDMATRREMEPMLYAAGDDALLASCYAVMLGFSIFSFVYFVYRSPIPLNRNDPQCAVSVAHLPRWFFYCAVIFLVVGSLGKWQVISSFGGLSVDLLLNLSASVRQANDARASAMWVFLASLFDVGLYMLLFYTILIRRNYLLAALLISAGVVLTVVIGGKRIAALGFLVAAATWYIQIQKPPIRQQLLLVFAALAISTLALLARIAIPTALLGSVEHAAVALDTVTRPVQTVLDSGELGLFEGTNFAFESRSDFLSNHGSGLHLLLHQTLASAVFLIPRVVWPTKPEAFDFSQMFYSLVVGGDRSTGWGIGPIGVGYIWGGWFGVLLTALMAGALARTIDVRLLASLAGNSILFIVPFILISFFHLLRFGSPGFMLVNAYMNLIPVICVYCALRSSGARVRRVSSP